MAALMTCDRDDISRVAKFIRECRAMEIAILPPDVNESGREFLATSGGIRFALTGIKGVGEGVVECIIEERAKRGAFLSFQDFFKRIDTRKVGKKAIEQMIEAGCFDFTKCSRRQLVHNVEPFYQRAAKEQKEANKGIINLFGADAEAEQPLAPGAPGELSNSPLDLLKKEKELLGFYLSGHPLDQYRERAKQLSGVDLEQAIQGDHDTVFRCVFVIEGVQVKLASRSQRKFAVLIVSDSEEPYEMTLWSDLYESKGQLLEEGRLLYAVLQVDKRESNPRFVCRWIEDFLAVDAESVKACDLAYDRARMQARLMDGREKKEGDHAKKPTPRAKEMSKKLFVDISLDEARLSHIVNMRDLFQQMAGDAPVTMRFYKQKDLHSELFIDASWGVKIENALRQQLEKIPSVIGIKIEEGTQ